MPNGGRTPGRPPRMAQIAGLDGVRAVALLVVVVFHFWPKVLPGGFLGVTMFFALSGYLITATVLHERQTTGRVGIAAFYARRLRRLLAASLLTIVGVIVVWAVAGWFTREVADNTTAAVLQVANWQRLFTHTPYGVSNDSLPLLHFWSLAIEEQVYWVFPLIAALGVTRRRFAAPLVALVVLAAALSWRWHGDSVSVYYSTFTRAGELALGALAALYFHRRRSARRSRTVTAAAAAGAAIGIAAFLVVCRVWSLTTPVLYDGGLLLVGLLCALTIGLLTRAPMVARMIDHPVLVWIGKRSYGMYLFHWPLIVGLRRAGVPGAPWWALAATGALAALSYRFVEVPVRTRRAVRRRPLVVASTAMAAVFAATLIVPLARTTVAGIDLADAQAAAAEFASSTSTTIPSAPADPGTTAPDEPITYSLFGDSKALVLGLSAGQYRSSDLQLAQGTGGIGCPLGRGGTVRKDISEGLGWTPDPGCDWSMPANIHVPAGGLDVVLVYYGSWDVAERIIPSLGGSWRTIDDDTYRGWLHQEMTAFSDEMHAAGVRHVAWLTLAPSMGPPDRVAMLNAMLDEVAAERPDTDSVIDLGGWLAIQPDLAELLPDHVHTTWSRTDPGSGLMVMQRFLADRIRAIAGV